MRIYLFDTHTDMPTVLFEGKETSVKFLEKFKKQVAVCSVWVSERVKNPYTYYNSVINDFKSFVDVSINALNCDKTILLSLEGGSPFEKDINRLYSIKNDGISSVMLTWNGDNSLAGGALGFGGLTEKGKEAIGLMNKLNLALDLSHLNDKSLFRAVEVANTVLASHSNCRSLCNHKRNLSDDALKIIKDKNGIVGINFYPSFLGKGNIFERILEQIEYFLMLGMENSICIGSDFDGGEMDESLSDTSQVIVLYEYLRDKLCDEELLDKIFFSNAYNFYKNLFDKKYNML